jgi:hypothetical protein
MKKCRDFCRPKNRISRLALLVLAAAASSLALQARAAAETVIWDTGSRLANAADAAKRTGWTVVPTELFGFEADPAKASSDPGYYGREYVFRGDAVVENDVLSVVCFSGAGRVVIFAKGTAAAPDATPPAKLGRKILEFNPLLGDTQATSIRHVEILRNACDDAALTVTFAAAGSEDASADLFFDRTGIAEIRPGDNFKRVVLHGPVEYGVVPGFVADDLIYGGSMYKDLDTLSVPTENLFVGLLPGADAELVMTWPGGQQQMQLYLAEREGRRLIESIEFSPAGQSFYLSGLVAPGIWHKEILAPSYLEKDIPINWHSPFPAKWKTQLYESKLKTTFAFRMSKGNVWRGVSGSYQYPVWFDGNDAYYHLSKKVPPKGESIIYCVEAQGTPASIVTPVDILKSTLGRPMCESILDLAGRRLRTHHRRAGDGVHRACTCGCTEAIQAVFEAKQEVARKTFVAEALKDMMYFVEQHVKRIDEYRTFADDTIRLLQDEQRKSPELNAYAKTLEQVVRQIPEDYKVQRENLGSLEYAHELNRKTLALTNRNDAQNLATYMQRLKDWRAMGGAQDYLVARCHMIAREVSQKAGYACVDSPAAAAVAKEVRIRCRQVLRKPDGYEIWANY